MRKTKLFIDAMCIAEDNVSGVGHTAISLVRALADYAEFTADYQIILLVPIGKKPGLERWNFPSNVKLQTYPLFDKVLNGLNRLGIMPPLDFITGKGVYLFPNYRNWPLAFSKSITYVHDATYAKYPEFTQPANLFMLQHNVTKWAARSSKIVTVSESAKQDLAKYCGIAKDKIEVVYNGVDSSIFKPQTKDCIADVKQKYGLDRDYFLYLSSLEPRKNVVRLLEAYEGLGKSITDKTALVLIGNDGWRNKDIFVALDKARAAGLKIIRPSVYVPDQDLPAIFSGAIALVHPAIYEGFGLQLVQAMATETPVLTSDVSSMPEIAGKAAILVDPLSTADISAAMTKLYANQALRQTLIIAGKQQVKKFTWQASAKRLRQIVKDL